MSAIKSIECERVAFVKAMDEYLHKLKEMPDSEARKQSKMNLLNSKILQENGEFTSQYKHSRKNRKLAARF